MNLCFSAAFNACKLGIFALLLWSATLLNAQSTKFLLAETNSEIVVRLTPDKQFPQDFRSIAITSSGTTTKVVAHDQIIRIPARRKERKAALIWSADATGIRIDPSSYFAVGLYTKEEKPHTLLFFLSDAAASDATPLLVIGFSDQGQPSKIFEGPYELTAFEQTDEGPEIIGKTSISQSLCDSGDAKAPSASTYDPYSVYLLQPGQKPRYMLNSARDYNRKHYVWAGSRSSESIAIVSNLAEHPKMFATPAANAQKLLAKAKCTP